ncbi:LuxR family transcriptional regulator [Knoellia sinensis KCTC 19936]|uniref:LuxR family transcriptional regulator n=1 Tax=Knoellia sinensis KCTC 19936 TaxID=1385520 RepID=A0A0A0JBC1_9MICO|nr:helix-turn-helix transcriptional regulator [Knoellia sinensis]KGN34079.1 LuxR family transcriptional regulator [Knoellia sinensis KCTC 19936]
MSEAQRLALALRADLGEACRDGVTAPPNLTLLGVGQREVMAGLARLESTTQRSAWSLLPHLIFDPEDLGYELNPRSTNRGVDLQVVTSPRTIRFNPLLTSFSPWVRVGPVPIRMILCDERFAVLEGPETLAGDTTAWLTTGGEFLDQARALWAATWQESRAVLSSGEEPPLNARQLEVARRVCLGRTDAAIARELGTSERTVARDVSVILDLTEARSRAEAVLNMLGRGRQSRT